MNKSKAERSHFQRRAIQRVQIFVSRIKINKIVSEIRQKKSIPLGRLTNRVSAHGVSINGDYNVILYDKNRKELITILAKENYLYNKLNKLLQNNQLTKIK